MNEYKNRGRRSTTCSVCRYNYIEISVKDLCDVQENKNNELTILFFFSQVYVEYLMLYNFQTDKACVLSSSNLEWVYSHFFNEDTISKLSLFLKKNDIILLSPIRLLD